MRKKPKPIFYNSELTYLKTVRNVIIEYNINRFKLKRFLNKKIEMDGIKLLNKLPDKSIPVIFFDPQYRGILDKLNFGKGREIKRQELPQMDDNLIIKFINRISSILKPSGHLFLWLDKFYITEGIKHWFKDTDLNIVDLVIWNKRKMGMGTRTRRFCEFVLIVQKKPKSTKGFFTSHNLPDIWSEKIINKIHVHTKPIKLQVELIKATSKKGDIIVDPCAGSFSVMKAARLCNRNFLGCDIQLYKGI